MYLSNWRRATRATALVAWLAGIGSLPESVRAREQSPGISPEQFVKVHKLIKPHPGESRWREISWLTSLWEARKKAAAEGKPIVVWSGSGGAPLCHT